MSHLPENGLLEENPRKRLLKTVRGLRGSDLEKLQRLSVAQSILLEYFDPCSKLNQEQASKTENYIIQDEYFGQ